MSRPANSTAIQFTSAFKWQSERIDYVRDHPNGSLLLVRVVPGASAAQVVMSRGGELKVRVCSPPIDGRANEEVVRVVAAALDLRGRDVKLVAGHRARSKQLLVALPAAELHRRVQLVIQRALGH